MICWLDLILVKVEMLSVVDGFSMRLVHGMLLNPLTLNWSWSSDTAVGYALHAVKSTHDSSVS